jgi:hypothetical protein
LKNLLATVCFATSAIAANVCATTPGTPEAGGGWVAVQYDYIHLQYHLDPNGDKVDIGSMNGRAVTTQIEYGVTDRLAVYAALPYIERKYSGSSPHTAIYPDGTRYVSETDDGSYHGSFQDWLVGTKYQMGVGSWMVTPTIAYGYPTHDYYTFSHAAIGGNQKKTDVGILTGRGLPEPFDRFFLEIDYLYSFMEKFEGVTANRSTLFFETDYYATERLMLRLYATGQKTHGGISPADWVGHPEIFMHHEQIQRTDFIDAGIGVVYLLNGRYSMFSQVTHTFWGENVHGIKYDVAIGISRGF